MADERNLVPIDKPYLEAVGMVAIAFARTEWDAAWCCERMQPGYLNLIDRGHDSNGARIRGKTAGDIGADLVRLFAAHSDATVRAKGDVAAREFAAAVVTRNQIVHGKPGQNDAGEQRLFYKGKECTIDDLNKAADQIVLVGQPLNAMLYNELQPAAP